MRSVLAEEFNCLHEVWTEEQASDMGSTAVELKRKQINAILSMARLLAEVHVHLVLVVRSAFELPRADSKTL
jgi:hypothetical protein